MNRTLFLSAVLVAWLSGAAAAQQALVRMAFTTIRALPPGRSFTWAIAATGAVAIKGALGNEAYDIANNLTRNAFRNAFGPPPDPPKRVPADPPAAPSPTPTHVAVSIDLRVLADPAIAAPAPVAPVIAPPPSPPACNEPGLSGLVALQRAASHDQGASFAKRDAVAAERCYYIAAQQNIPLAQYDLADMLMDGDDGVAADPGRAVQYLEAAARSGFLPAQLRLADAYDRGEGAARNPAAAFFWYGEAASLSGYAQYQLSRYYYYGLDGGLRSRNDAFLWLNRALRGGYQPAAATMADLLAVVETDAQAGEAGANFTVGMAYEQGVPGLIAADLSRAALFYRAAAARDWAPAEAAIRRLCAQATDLCD